MRTYELARKKKHSRGLMLIEILIVIAIIGTITALVAWNFVGTKVDADIKATKIQMSSLDQNLQLFFVRRHRFPTAAEGLQVLTQGRRPIIRTLPTDAFGSPFLYRVQPEGYALISKGPDGVLGTEDDIETLGAGP